MSLSRRGFIRTLGTGGLAPLSGALVAARGREALAAALWPDDVDAAGVAPPAEGEIRIDSNENPLGPGPAAIEAIVEAFGDAGRYPMNAKPAMADLRGALAREFEARPENVGLGAGSGEVLRGAVRAFTSANRAFVTAVPSFEAPERLARQMGVPVKEIAVDEAGRLDLEKMAAASQGAGLVFVCNPNNPTGTVHGEAAIRDFVKQVRQSSPETVILLDEAYHEYVTDASYRTGAPLALSDPKVIVTRTFSKAYGMAGLRVGYVVGHKDAVAAVNRYAMPYTTNVLGVAAAYESIKHPDFIEKERARNTEVRRFTQQFFESAGLTCTDSNANFLFVNVGRTAREFREACAQHRVHVGRDFPPFEKTHSRISIGTMDEMRRAVEVFGKVLGTPETTAGVGA